MKIDSDLIMRWTNDFTNVFYNFVVKNFYFLLSNLVLVIYLIVFDLTINNLLFYTLPIFLHINSYSIQFNLIENNNYEWKDYWITLKKSLKKHWQTYLVMTLLLQGLILNIALVIDIRELNFILIPLLITGAFMVNSFYYYMNYYMEQSEKSLRNSITSSLILSYGRISAFLKNTLVLVVSLLLAFFISPIIVLFFGDLITRFILKNIE